MNVLQYPDMYTLHTCKEYQVPGYDPVIFTNGTNTGVIACEPLQQGRPLLRGSTQLASRRKGD